MSRWRGHFGTLMPFYHAWSVLKAPPAPLSPPKSVPVADGDPRSRCGARRAGANAFARTRCAVWITLLPGACGCEQQQHWQ